MNGEMAGTHK